MWMLLTLVCANPGGTVFSQDQLTSWGCLCPALQTFLDESREEAADLETDDEWDVLSPIFLSWVPVDHPQELIDELRAHVWLHLGLPKAFADPKKLQDRISELSKLSYLPAKQGFVSPPEAVKQ